MSTAVIAALLSLAAGIVSLLLKTLAARTDAHAQTLAEGKAALEKVNTALAELTPILVKNDADTDAALDALEKGQK